MSMTGKALENLDAVLKALGTDTFAGLLVLLFLSATIAATQGLYALLTGWHTRRKEFVELYEKLQTDSPDPLALEMVVRHGFGEWLPAEAILRIRGRPWPSQRLRALDGLLPFLEIDELNGSITIKPKYASRARRNAMTAAYFVAYFLCGILFAFAAGLIVEQANSLLPSSRILLGILSLGYGLYSINTAMNLQKLSGVCLRYPDLFTNDIEKPTTLATTARQLAVRLFRLASRTGSLIKGRALRRHLALSQSATPPSAARSSRSASAESTPRA
jgi:hypothetical protein